MKKIAPIFIFMSGVLWGSLGIYVRQFNEKGIESIEIVAIRAISTSIIMLLFLLFYDNKLLKIKIKDIWCFIGTGILSIIFFNFCYFKAMTMTSLSIAAVLLYTAPAIVMILSRILFNEKFSAVKIISLAATFLGCVLVTGITGDTGSISAAGILTGLGSGLGYALYSIFSRYAIQKGYHSFTISFYTFLIATVGIIFIADMPKVWSVCGTDMSMIGFSFIFGLMSTVLPYVLYTIGLGYVENGKASIIASVEPVVATMLGIVLFQEKMTLNGILGMTLVLGSIVLCNINIRTKDRK